MSENTIWVIAHEGSVAKELVTKACCLGAPVSAVVLGDASSSAEEVSAAGANVVLKAEKPANGLIETLCPAIVAALTSRGAGLILVQGSTTGRFIAGTLASLFETSALNASELSIENGVVQVRYLVYGGTAVCTRAAKSTTAVVVAGPEAIAVSQSAPASEGQGTIELLDTAASEESVLAKGVRVISTAPRQTEAVNLAAASRVVGVGRGFKSEGDLDIARALATAIGAELACSRPITESENWMARERYIGVSGAVIKPDVYVALGISGQVQHMVGITQAKIILAVNKDKNAPVFKYADVGIVGDIYEVVPALTGMLKA